ncbi:hypothetical protein T492DRAFT_177511 [Pavlovales sp. CCMP2436]|nr:hypothetical protein T492DRAFT_177511 [Pavlovales sp. CCMP2436]
MLAAMLATLLLPLALGAPAPFPLTGSACDLISVNEKLCTCFDLSDHKFMLDCEIPLRLGVLNFTDSIGMKVRGIAPAAPSPSTRMHHAFLTTPSHETPIGADQTHGSRRLPPPAPESRRLSCV